LILNLQKQALEMIGLRYRTQSAIGWIEKVGFPWKYDSCHTRPEQKLGWVGYGQNREQYYCLRKARSQEVGAQNIFPT